MNLAERFEAMDVAAIENFVADRQEENLHLDFKTADPRLTRDDRRNLAEAVSGFANSDGGLIVWGVDARPNQDGIDVAVGTTEISPLSLFLGRLNQFTGDAATLVVDGILHKRVPVREDSGFAVTLVPASDGGPHMAKLGVDRYLKRSGSQFLRMEHFEVEDMFGRRPKPFLDLAWRAAVGSTRGDGEIQYRLVLGIKNSGRGSARAPFVTLRIDPPHRLSGYGVNGNYNVGLPRLVSGPGLPDVNFGGTSNVMIHPGLIHDVTAVEGRLPPTSSSLDDVVVHYSIVAEDTRPRSGALRICGADIVAALRKRNM